MEKEIREFILQHGWLIIDKTKKYSDGTIRERFSINTIDFSKEIYFENYNDGMGCWMDFKGIGSYLPQVCTYKNRDETICQIVGGAA